MVAVDQPGDNREEEVFTAALLSNGAVYKHIRGGASTVAARHSRNR